MKYKFSYFFILSLLYVGYANAQVPEDALRNAWFAPNGTARNVAIGGAMGSLGGDISANNINPAGIGMYKTSEIVVTPLSLMMNNNKSTYHTLFDSTLKQSKTGYAYGPIGLITGWKNRGRSSWTSSAFSISVTQLASYNNRVQYSGFNNISSFTEQYLEELAYDGADTYAASNNYANGASLAFNTYLIDTLQRPGGGLFDWVSNVPVGTPAIPSGGVIQNYDSKTKGGYHEASIAFAGNQNDKFYLGGSFNIPFVHYERELLYSEDDATGNNNNNFSYFDYTENFKSTGWGINAKIGVIFKPMQQWRFGVAFHTPSFLYMKDELSASITANTENYPKKYGKSGSTFTETTRDVLGTGRSSVTREYTQVTPLKAIVSASYVIREVSDTKLQRGFITADVEFVNYKGMRFKDREGNSNYESYLDQVNDVIKDYYKNAFNFRLGGELKFDPWAFRLGAAYYGGPYADDELKASKTIVSGGVGFRSHGVFVDLTYAYSLNKDVSLPYVLGDKPNVFADVKNSRSNIVLTLGFKI